ncbi:DUF5675 family protein [Marinobacter sp. M1N3S26]|uniref:DUF5675 family protein n=1 Tax=Marinobacter sp. M1N3S26 TaxID=3382299 RepID=UPI00387B40A8
MPAALRLTRFCYAPDGTFGRLELPDGTELFTCERPWEGNKRRESCIPDGVYTLRMRRSGVVERSTGGKYLEGWEVVNVPGRSYIMLHPANWPDQLEGCIAPGLGFGIISEKQAVTSSQDAFDKLMSALAGQDEWEIDIRPFIMEHP